MRRIEKNLKQSAKGKYFTLTASEYSAGCIVAAEGKEMTVKPNTPYFARKEIKTSLHTLVLYFIGFRPDITLFSWDKGYEKQIQK